ncbi:MAG: murein biosynthesis integral membrane protein MurJ [Sphaerochaeta sp.]
MKDSTQNNNSKSSFYLMIFTLLSRLLGIVKARVITSVFGAGLTADVINTAYYLPNNFRKLFAEGAMNTAFIPSLSKIKEKRDRNTLLSLIMSFQIILFVLLILVFSIFGKHIFSFISDFNTEGTVLGGQLLPYFIVFLALISLSTIFASILQYEKKFIPYGIAPLFFNIVLIFFVYKFSGSLGAMSMAYGVVLSSAVQLIFTLIFVLKLDYRVRISLLFKNDEFRHVMKVWLQIILSNLALLASQQYSAYLSTTLSTGSATAFSNSMIFFSAPYGIIFTGIATVCFPDLSRFFADKDERSFKKSLSYASDSMLFLFIPASIALMSLSKETVAVVLQNGLFTYEDTLLTAEILYHFLAGLTIVGLNGLMIRVALSRTRAKLTLKVTVIQASLDALLSYLMIKNGIGIKSLAIANNISALTALVIYLYFLHVSFNFKHFFKTLIRAMLLNVPLIIGMYAYHSTSPTWFVDGSTLRNFLIFLVIGIISIVLTIVIYLLNHVPIFDFLKKTKKKM